MKMKIWSCCMGIVMIITISLINADAKTKYVKEAEVTNTMVEFTKALGVKCDFCHVANRSQTYKDLAGKTVDANELSALVHQRIARAMLGAMMYLNKKEGKALSCNSCHRGKAEVEVGEGK